MKMPNKPYSGVYYSVKSLLGAGIIESNKTIESGHIVVRLRAKNDEDINEDDI